MNIWVYENEVNSKLRDEAISIIQDMPEYALVIHWCMMMASYPVFVDMCKLIGRLSEFQNEISLSQIKQRLYDELISLTSKPDSSMFDGSRSTPSLWWIIPCETSSVLSSMMFCITVESVMGISSGLL